MPSSKYIFLDIDGVISLMDKSNTFFDTGCVELVAKLVKETGATIVLSSDWRFNWETKDISARILKENQTDLYVGATTSLARGYMVNDVMVPFENRGQEISKFLQDKNYETYVVLDDLPAYEFEDHRLHLVSCHYATGFTQEAYERAWAILNDHHEIPPNSF